MIELQTDTNLFGEEIAGGATIDRAMLAAALYANLKDISLEEFVSYLTNPFEAVVDYANLCVGAKTGQRISLLFNPHRLDTGSKLFPISIYARLKKESFHGNLARTTILNKEKTRDILYASIGMGMGATSYIQEFPPHVARDLALEYNLSRSSRVLDPCAGWGGRIIGFSTIVDSYTCCEPSTRTAAGLRKLHDWLRVFRSTFNATIHEVPFEDVELLQASFDFALTSPPYYDTERYAPGEATNSFNRYPTFDAWCEGFYAPLIHRTMAALKPGAAFVLNIGSRVYPLNNRLFAIAQGHYGVEKQKGRLSTSNGLGKDGEGETFYEIRNPSGVIVVQDASQAPTQSQSTVETKTLLTQPDALASAPRVVSTLDAFLSTAELARTAQDASEPTMQSQSTSSESTPISQPDANLQAFARDLRSRGHRLLTRDGKLFVSDASKLSSEARATIKGHKPALLALAEPWVEPKPASTLAQFLGTAPPVIDWQPDAPPDLAGLDAIVLNFATNGLDWAHGHRPVGVTVSTLDGQLCRFLPFRFAGGNLDEAVVKRWTQEQLRGKKIYNANTRFDIHHAREWGVDLEAQGCTFTDVQHTAALLDDSRRKFAIDELAKAYLPDNVEILRVDESRHHEHHASEVAARERYTAQLVGRLRAVMDVEIEKQDLQRVQALEDAVIPVVCEMERNAAPIDVPLLKQWCAETKQQVDGGLQQLSRELGFAFNPDSNPDWQRLFERFGLPFGGMTESGKPSFTDKILKSVDHPSVQLARKVGKLLSLRAKFLVAYDEAIGADGLLHFNLHQLRVDDKGTVRGRFSASDKNIQQVMNHDTHMTSFDSEDYFVRRLFIPGSGLLYAADAAQIEFRLFAHYSGSERLFKAYRDDPNVSFHRVAEGILKSFKSDLPYTKVKSMNFLFVYGGGKTHLADYLEVPQKVADEFYDIYHRAFPEVKTLSKKAEGLAKSRGYVRSLLGRRARFPDPAFAYKALNAVIQPSAADIFKQKSVEVHAERKRLGITLRMPVHDELVMDVPDQESAAMVGEILNRQSFAEVKVPILWAGRTGRNWAECK